MAAGMVDISSKHSVDVTLTRLEELLRVRGIEVFAIVDHSGEAEKVGLKLAPTKLVIFGNPKAGTPLMQAAPSTAIDLPLKILVWEDSGGEVWVSYNSPEFLRERHGFPAELIANIAAEASLAEAASS